MFADFFSNSVILVFLPPFQLPSCTKRKSNRAEYLSLFYVKGSGADVEKRTQQL